MFQTLSSISAEKNSTIIFPLPMEMFAAFDNDGLRKRQAHIAAEDWKDEEASYSQFHKMYRFFFKKFSMYLI